MADTDYISVRRLRTFLAQMKQWVLGFAANRNTQAMSDVTKDTGISGTVAIGKSITIHTASGAQTANVMNADMIVGEKPTTNKELASKAPTINLVDSMVMEAISDAFDDITTIEYQSVNNAGKLPQVGQAGVIYLCSVWEEVENPTGNPHDLGYYVYTNGEYVLTADTTVQDETTYYTKAMATDEYIWLASESRYEPLGQAKVDLTGLLFAGSATSGGTAYKAAAIPFGRVDSTSTSTNFTASVEGITALEDGVCVLLQNGVVASASGFTLNINNLGAHPCFNNMTAATRDTTIFAKDYTMLMVYDATRVVGGITGAWCCYRGYDANTNTIGYQVRTNSATLPVKFTTYRYRLYFTSADGTHWVGANASTSTNATSSRTPTSEKINPFGPIIYYPTNGTTNKDAVLTATAIWQQYTLTLGYSFNHTGAALVLEYPKPVYLKCEPQSDGSVKIAGSNTVASYVQELPTTEDGFVYIFLGIAYAATTMELRLEHPVYYFKGGEIRLWTNQAAADVEIKKYNSDKTDESEGIADYGQTDVVINGDVSTIVTTQAPPSAVRQYIAPSWRAMNQKLAEKADVDAIPTKTSDLTNDSGYVKHSNESYEGHSGNWIGEATVEGIGVHPSEVSYTILNRQGIKATGTNTYPLYIINSSKTKILATSTTNGTVSWANLTGESVTVYVAIDDDDRSSTFDFELFNVGFDSAIEGLQEQIGGKQDTISDLETIRSGASKGATAIQPTDIKDELDPGGNGEIPDSAAIATYISERNFVEHDSTQRSNGNGTCSYADSLGSTNFYSTGPITYTIAPNQKISFDSQDSTMGYIVKASGSGDGTNQAILASKANGDVEWFNDTGSSVIIRFASATNNENYSYTIVDCGYDDTIEHVYDKIGDAVQSVVVSQTASGNDPGTTITIDGGTAHPIVKDNEPGGSSNASVAPSWGAMKEAISDKVDKVTSTDNAVVRFDGTGGAIQNSGVTINDSNHITAVKHITSGGTSSQFVKGDGSLDSSAYVKEGMWMMPTNAFGGSSKAIQINLINNGFYAAHLRATVTLTGFTAGSAGQLFDGNYETCLTLPAGQTGVILIDSGSTPLFGSYSYGYTYFSFYYNNMPDSISMRVYGTRSSGGENWYDLGSATAFYASSGAYCYRIQNSGTYNCKKWEITIVAKSDTIATQNATFPAKITSTGFVKSGGTSSQFLKADGSVDSNNYVTLTSLNSALSEKVDYADGTKTTTTKQMGTTTVTIDGISMYTSESTTYTIQNGYTISIDAQGTSTGYIYQNSNSTILVQDPSGDVEWTNTTGESVVVKIGSATSGENYSVTIFKKGYYSTIEELTEKIEEAAASGVQADWNEDDSDDPAYIKNKPTVYTKPLSGIPKGDLANAVQTSLGKADSAVQSVTVSQSSAVGTGGTTIQVDNGNAYQIVSDGEPQGSDNGYVAPTWGAMKTLLGGKVDSVELVKHKTDESDESYDTCQTDLFVDDISLGTIVATSKPVTSQRPYVAPSWQGFEEKLSTKSDKSNTYTKSEVDGLVSGINNNVIIGELPSTGQLQNRIYRVPGTNSYTDWAWNGSSWVKLAEFSGSIFMQITEAEYDALSDSEKNNGTWYFIEEE